MQSMDNTELFDTAVDAATLVDLLLLSGGLQKSC